MAVKPLSKKDIEKQLRLLTEWKPSTKHTQISRTFTFKTYINALAFIAKIAVHAEVMQHHPDIEFSYTTVKVKLATHDAKGLTKKDFELAAKIDSLRID